jgi:lysophospholipase L1-like esterase
MHIRILLIAFLIYSQAGFCQSTLVKDLSLFIDTTLRTDVPLTILQTEFPVTVSAGDEWSGKFTILNYGKNIAHQSFKAQIFYENRQTYVDLVQHVGRWEGTRFTPQTPVEISFKALAPAQLPAGSTKIKLKLTLQSDSIPLMLAMKYHSPHGYYEVGKINVLNKGSKKKKRMVFFGDSITQEATMPEGYVSQLEKMGGKLSEYELIGAGIGGDRVTSLWARADADVLVYKPQTVVIFVGVNDCSWFKAVPHIGGTKLETYEEVLTDLVRKFQKNKMKVVVCTPAVLGEKKEGDNELDQSLNQYAQVCRKVAEKNGCTLVDLRKVFMSYISKNNPQNLSKGILTTDGVHLTSLGSRLVAESMFKAL